MQIKNSLENNLIYFFSEQGRKLFNLIYFSSLWKGYKDLNKSGILDLCKKEVTQ